ncbi:MAG TPA: hypothetical protein VGO00_07450, partial [Kofleriaceae bacterium]|nr:hypothetical protein [Kofleriaceae bacterium]
MASACELIDAELAVDRLEAELAAELPAHMRAFALAHAAGRSPPPAPPIARRGLDTALRACVHAELADRGLALVRLLAPIAIEDDPIVAAARGVALTWAHYDALMRARDDAAQRRFGRGVLDLIHRLHGSHLDDDASGRHARHRWDRSHHDGVDGWHVRDHELDAQAIDAAWTAIASLTGARGTVQIERANVRPRAFVVEPGAVVIVVVPAQVDTPAARFAVLHELGHAVCALVSKRPVARVVDEAVASAVARSMEGEDALDPRWASPLAAEARRRRIALAALLDRRERELIETGHASPPWALWHDPGSQAAYVAAET